MADTSEDEAGPARKPLRSTGAVGGEANGGSEIRSMQAFLIFHEIILNPRLHGNLWN